MTKVDHKTEKCTKGAFLCPVIWAIWNHLFPFRTEKWNRSASMIVYGQLYAKVDHRRANKISAVKRIFCLYDPVMIRACSIFLNNYRYLNEKSCASSYSETPIITSSLCGWNRPRWKRYGFSSGSLHNFLSQNPHKGFFSAKKSSLGEDLRDFKK